MTYDEGLDLIAHELMNYFEDDPIRMVYWLMEPNTLFGDVCPAWLALAHPGGMEKLVKFIENARDERSDPQSKLKANLKKMMERKKQR